MNLSLQCQLHFVWSGRTIYWSLIKYEVLTCTFTDAEVVANLEVMYPSKYTKKVTNIVLHEDVNLHNLRKIYLRRAELQ